MSVAWSIKNLDLVYCQWNQNNSCMCVYSVKNQNLKPVAVLGDKSGFLFLFPVAYSEKSLLYFRFFIFKFSSYLCFLSLLIKVMKIKVTQTQHKCIDTDVNI